MAALIPWAALVGVALAAPPCADFLPPQRVGRLGAPIVESSGLAPSMFDPDRWYTHEDGGGGAMIYAIRGDGTVRAVVTLDAINFDWEDLAVGPCAEALSCLFVAGVGDNQRLRSFVRFYRLPEPLGDGEYEAGPAVGLTAYYPDGPRDAEAAMVDPVTGDLFVVEKTLGLHPRVAVLRGAASLAAGPYLMAPMGRLKAGVLVTGGDIDPGGRLAVLRGYGSAATLYGLVRDDHGHIVRFVRGAKLEIQPFGEAIAFSADGQSVWTTTEGRGATVGRSRCRSAPTPEPRSPPPPHRQGCAGGLPLGWIGLGAIWMQRRRRARA